MKKLWWVSLCIAWSLWAAPVSAETAAVSAVLDKDYYPTARRLIKEAQETIQIGMFQARFYPEHPQSPSNILWDDLIAAFRRGVAVEVCLHHSRGHLQDTSAQNLQVAQRLAGAGVAVYLARDDQTMHAKFMVVDGRYLLLGSTNWSYYSLHHNREANLLVDCEALAGVFRTYLDDIKGEGQPLLSPGRSGADGSAVSGAQARTCLVNIKTASLQELQTVPGIGPAIAARIIAYRAEHPLETMEDLLEVRGIGPQVLERISPYLEFSSPYPDPPGGAD